jgi:hypothetical protein
MKASPTLRWAIRLRSRAWIGLALAALACRGDALEWHCDDNAEVRVGTLRLVNNVWNKGSVRDYEQCVSAGRDSLRWKWSWPGGDTMPEAFPEIVFGWHPWRDASTSPDLPRRLADLEELRVEYDARVEGEGVYNLAFQLWLVDRLPPRPDAARAEVMVWVANRGMQPAGRPVRRAAIGGVEYDLYEAERKHLDRGTWRAWSLVTLVSRERRMAGPLDVSPLLRALSEQGRLDETLWVANLDLGTEVVAGSGHAEVAGYRIEVR